MAYYYYGGFKFCCDDLLFFFSFEEPGFFLFVDVAVFDCCDSFGLFFEFLF